MDKKLYIQNYCHIRNNEVLLNGKVIYIESTPTSMEVFFKNVFKSLEIKYPKFFKMDNLSKLSFLAAELTLNSNSENNTAIVLSNNSSSLETDRKHQKTINNKENYYPSPALFVYTLPNIGIGEISIRHNLKTESAFFVFENFNPRFHNIYENHLIKSKKANKVLSGWINVDENEFEAFVYLVAKEGIIEHTEEKLINLYKK